MGVWLRPSVVMMLLPFDLGVLLVAPLVLPQSASLVQVHLARSSGAHGEAGNELLKIPALT
jgi:hypothetical protein